MYVGSTSQRGFDEMLRQLVNYTFHSINANTFSLELSERWSGHFVAGGLSAPISDRTAISFEPIYDGRMPGFEFLVLNSLCKIFRFRILDRRGDELVDQLFEKGVLRSGEIRDQFVDAREIRIDFELDDSIFDIPHPPSSYFYNELIGDTAFLYKGKLLSIALPVAGAMSHSIFKFENGLADRVGIERLKGLGGTYFDTIIEKQFKEFSIEAAYAFREHGIDESFLVSYVNYIRTPDEGVHVDGVLQGVGSALLKHSQDLGISAGFKFPADGIRKRLIAAVHVKMDRPLFEGSFRYKLISDGIAGQIAHLIGDDLSRKMKRDRKSTEVLIRQMSRGR